MVYTSIFDKQTRSTFKIMVHISHRPNSSLSNIFYHVKLNENIYSDSGKYKLKCNNFEKHFVGQTGMTFKARFKTPNSKNLNATNSTFAGHLLKYQHR